MEPAKPFACTMSDCGMTFTNEDHLHVHTKKHDMVLQLGMEQRAAFVADQTPTPTRFIRNCEEVGLFQDLQNVSVNPFDEGFKRAMETKNGALSTETFGEEALHTPHLVFPTDAGDCTLYTANNQRNITISRSSSDESGAVKEYETTTISKRTNEVTTISRVVGKPENRTATDDVIKHTDKDRVNETVYTNNVIKILSNVEIRKDEAIHKVIEQKEEALKDIPPIMSQKSLDYVVDSLTTDCQKKTNALKRKPNEEKIDTNDFEVVIKMPNGKSVKMRAVDDENAKEKLKRVITNKVQNPLPVQNVLPISGTLIPVTLVTPSIVSLPKVPIAALPRLAKKPGVVKSAGVVREDSEDEDSNRWKTSYAQSRKAASKRYRERFKTNMKQQSEENRLLREANLKLIAEKAMLKVIITQHLKRCPNSEDLRARYKKICDHTV